MVHLSVAGLAAGQRDGYSATKLQGEAVAHAAAAAHGIDVTIIRPGVVWGVVDDFSRNLAAGILHAPVFPTPYPAGAVAVVHVEDVATAVVRAATGIAGRGVAEPAGAAVQTLDVVGPEALSLSELIHRTSGMGPSTTLALS